MDKYIAVVFQFIVAGCFGVAASRSPRQGFVSINATLLGKASVTIPKEERHPNLIFVNIDKHSSYIYILYLQIMIFMVLSGIGGLADIFYIGWSRFAVHYSMDLRSCDTGKPKCENVSDAQYVLLTNKHCIVFYPHEDILYTVFDGRGRHCTSCWLSAWLSPVPTS